MLKNQMQPEIEFIFQTKNFNTNSKLQKLLSNFFSVHRILRFVTRARRVIVSRGVTYAPRIALNSALLVKSERIK